MPALGGCAQSVESPHYDDYAPLHCLPEFVAGDGVHVFVGVLAVEVLSVRLGIMPVCKFAVMSSIVVTVLAVSPPSTNNATRSISLHVTVVDPMRRDWMSASMSFFLLCCVGLTCHS